MRQPEESERESVRAAHPDSVREPRPSPITDLPESGALSDEPEAEGGRVGPYKLLQRLGEGGFGVVFMAEQEAPVRRRVALKVVKLGMDTRQVVARFEQERQALALMEHPNIARVFDAGATASGRPYFVMELVRGVPITEYCDANHLTPRERLEVFVPACMAVQHAHQKGVIHRDIKPSNVLVTLHDGKPVPKIIDFGIAKATDRRLTEKTLFTELHAMIGTPAYMSPEQAEMSGLDIDTRSDVYGLGVLLYELLTGTTPFSQRELLEAGYAGMLRLIREVEPPRPSTRVSTLGAKLSAMASKRRTEPKRLGLVLRGDLDWIVMKALEKDRARRYESAAGLAQDIQRHLQGETVLAAPPSAAYRLRKLARRNKGAVAAIAATAGALVIGMAGVLWQWAEARAQYEQAVSAQRELGVEKTRTEQALREALDHRARTERQTYVANLLAAEAALGDQNLPLARERLQECPDAERGWEWRYLMARASVADFVIPGWRSHLTPDGRHLLAHDYYGPGQLWEIATGREVRSFQSSNSYGLDIVSFSPDGGRVLLGTSDYVQATSVRSVATGDVLQRLSKAYSPRSGEFSPDGRWALVCDDVAYLWDTLSGLDFPLAAGDESVSAAHFNSDGTLVVTASGDGVARIWEVSSGRLLKQLSGHTGIVNSARFSPSSERIVSASEDNTVRVWNTHTGEVVFVLHQAVYNPGDAAYDADGTRIVAQNDNGGFFSWDAETGAFQGVFVSGQGCVASAGRIVVETGGLVQIVGEGGTLHMGWGYESFDDREPEWGLSPDSTRALVSSPDGTLSLWDLTSSALLATCAPKESFEQFAFSPDGSRFVVRDSDVVDLFDSSNGARIANLVNGADAEPAAHGDASLFRFSPSATSQRIGVLLDRQRLVVLSTVDGSRVANLVQGDSPRQYDLEQVVFSEDGEAAWASNNEGIGPIWQVGSGQVIARSLPPLGGLEPDGFAAFSPSGHLCVASSPEPGLRVLDTRTLAETVLADVRPGTESLRFLGSDSRLLTRSSEGMSELWDVWQGNNLVKDDKCDALAYAEDIALSPDGTYEAATLRDGCIRVDDLAHGTERRFCRESPLRLLCFGADDALFATSEPSGRISIWSSVFEGEPLRSFTGGPSTHASVATFDPDGSRLAIHWGALGWIVPTDPARPAIALQTAPADVDTVAFRDGGTRLLAYSGLAIVGVWDALSGKLWPPSLAELGRPLARFEFTPDLTRILAQTSDGDGLLLDAGSGRELATLFTQVEQRASVARSGDGALLVTADTRATHASLFRPLEFDPEALGSHEGGVHCIDLTPDGAHLLTGSADRTAALWRVADGTREAVLAGHDGTVVGAVLASDASRAITVTERGTATFWEMPGGKKHVLVPEDGERVTAAAIASDGACALTVSGRSVDLWDARDGTLLGHLAHPAPVSASQFAPDGRSLLSGCSDGTAILWDVAARQPRRTLALASEVSCLAFDGEGQRIAVGCESGRLLLVDLATGREQELAVHDSRVLAAVFAPDTTQARVYTSSADREIRVWDPERPRELLTLYRMSDPCEELWTTEDGRVLVAVTTKGTARSWDSLPARVPVTPSRVPELFR